MATMTRRMRPGAGWRAGTCLVIGGAGVAALAFYASLLPWKFGVWSDTEPMVVALHGAAALCAMGLLLCAVSRPQFVGRFAAHPVVVISLFVAVWSLLVAPFADYPVLSLLGSPQLGEGALYHADVAVFLAAGMLLRRFPAAYRGFTMVAATICAVTPLLIWALDVGALLETRRLFVFDDYLAYYAVAGAALILCRRDLPIRRRVILAGLVALPGLAVSNNSTAIVVVLALATPAAWALHCLNAKSAGSVRLSKFALALSAPLLAGAGILIVWSIGQTGEVGSLTSRLFMYRALLPVLTEDPTVLLVGQGWGAVNTSVLINLAQSGAKIWDGSWDLSARDIPHSHNFVLEALLGGGLPAMLGVLALLMLVAATARRRDLPAAAFAVISLAGLGAMWFQLPATSGLMAIVLGGLAGPVRIPWRRYVVPRRWLLAGLVAVLVAQIATLNWLIDYGVAAQRADRAGYNSADDETCGAFPSDAGRGSIGLTQAFGDLFASIFTKQHYGEPIADEKWDRLARLYCVVTRRAARSESARLLLGDLVFRSQVAAVFDQPGISQRFSSAIEGWEEALVRFLDHAPGRTDMAAPYLAWLLDRRNPERVVTVAQELLSRNPRDPVGHWFLGVGLVAFGRDTSDANRNQARQHMSQALALGLQRYIKVDPEVLHFLNTKTAQ